MFESQPVCIQTQEIHVYKSYRYDRRSFCINSSAYVIQVVTGHIVYPLKSSIIHSDMLNVPSLYNYEVSCAMAVQSGSFRGEGDKSLLFG